MSDSTRQCHCMQDDYIISKVNCFRCYCAQVYVKIKIWNKFSGPFDWLWIDWPACPCFLYRSPYQIKYNILTLVFIFKYHHAPQPHVWTMVIVQMLEILSYVNVHVVSREHVARKMVCIILFKTYTAKAILL
jgi:hypothetical protein